MSTLKTFAMLVSTVLLPVVFAAMLAFGWSTP